MDGVNGFQYFSFERLEVAESLGFCVFRAANEEWKIILIK